MGAPKEMAPIASEVLAPCSVSPTGVCTFFLLFVTLLSGWLWAGGRKAP